MLVPVESSRAAMADEVDAALAWARRHRWALEVDLEGLTLRARTRHPRDRRLLYLEGSFDDYKALAPVWLFATRSGDTATASAWPSAGSVGGSSSILHSVGVICAHFSRRAYREHGGPHAGDWGSGARWLDIVDGVQATTIGDMLAVIDLHVRASPGRMG